MRYSSTSSAIPRNPSTSTMLSRRGKRLSASSVRRISEAPMDVLSELFKSIVDQDTAPIVVCDISHIIVYMNPAAVEVYSDRGGSNLVGLHIFDCHSPRSNDLIREVVDWFSQDAGNNIVHTFYSEKQNKDVYMVALRDAECRLIGYYEKHEYRNRDTSPFYDMKR